jgi:hypothetical protein
MRESLPPDATFSLFIAPTDVDVAVLGLFWYTSELKVKFCSWSPFVWHGASI